MKLLDALRALVLITLACVGQWATAQTPAASPRGLALVVGNATYQKGALHTPTADSAEMAATLRQLGYEVILAQDLTLKEFKSKVDAFAASAASLKLPTLFYYAGHGVQVNGVSYLVPIDAGFSSVSAIPNEALSVDSVFDRLHGLDDVPKVFILDACRTNPYGDDSPTQWAPGLAAPTKAPANALIAFSTDPGNIAADGVWQHSPYTRSLLKVMRTPGSSVEDVFKAVRNDVISATDGLQTPWENTSLTRPLVLREGLNVLLRFNNVDDDGVVLVNGQEALSWNLDRSNPRSATLKVGRNRVEVKVYNQRSFTGGIEGFGGHEREGWRYDLAVDDPHGTSLLRLSSSEDRPPPKRHGALFTVAVFDLLVDEFSDQLSVVNLAEPR